MPAGVDEAMERAQRIDMEALVEETTRDTATNYLTLNKDQMLHGLTSTGEKIGTYRNPAYAAMKAQLNPLAGDGNVDLKLTGAYQGAMFVERRTDGLYVDSTDEKALKLRAQYGSTMFGLDDDYAQQYVDIAQPVLVEKVLEALGG
jgi:hypothetical protein